MFGKINSAILPGKLKNFSLHGEYKRDELNKLFQEYNIKLVCIFSIIPETFSYTFFESLACNIPVLAVNEGVVGQKISSSNLGWLIRSGDKISDIYKLIIEIFSNKLRYREIVKSIFEYKIKNLNEMIIDYDKLYSSFISSQNHSDNDERLKLFIEFNNSFVNFHNSIQSVYLKKIEQIYNSYTWRIGNSITFLPRKIKNSLKKIKYGNE